MNNFHLITDAGFPIVLEPGRSIIGSAATLLTQTETDDYLAIMQAGAYGFAMGSNYNGRLRPAKVLVNGDEFTVIRKRQSYEHLLDGCL